MNDPFKTLTGVSIGGLIVLFAMYGKGFWESAVAAWLFLLQITNTAPLGLWSFLIALIAGTLIELALERWIPQCIINPHGRRAGIELLTLLCSVAVSWMQMHALNGLLFGVLAGLLAPLIARVMLGAANYASRKLAGS